MDLKNKILVIDDDVQNIEIIQVILENTYEVKTASNGTIALEILKQFKPDLILLDWIMPILNGMETLKIIKSETETKNIPVIMMTGFMTAQTELLMAYNEGVIDFIRKPFDELELIARVNSIIQLGKTHKEYLDFKNRELAGLTLLLSEKNTFMNTIIHKLDLLPIDKNQTAVLSKIVDLKEYIRLKVFDKSWNEFYQHFVKVHPDFFNHLNTTHPYLTPAEIKLASLLRLNLNSKEISSIIHSTNESVRIARTRLRKKLNLKNEMNLTSYLMKF